MLNRVARTILMAVAVASVGAMVPVAHAQQQAAKKNWKDQAEYDLVASFTKETDPAKKIQILDTWKQKYPVTEFKEERLQYYLLAYQAANKPNEMVNVAKEMLAVSPTDLKALYWIATLAPTRGETSPDALDLAEKAGVGLTNPERPAGMADADWETAKKTMQPLGHKTVGWVNMQRKKNPEAEASFRESLKDNPNAGEVSYWMGTVILAQKNPDKQSEALFHFARAANYDGPGALSPQGRQQVDAYLTKAYTNYHGPDPAGLEELKKTGKAQALAPADFKIVSKYEIEAAQDKKFKEENPSLALWLGVKKQLTAADGEQYFESQLKGAGVPKLKGRLISQKPAVNPTILVVGIEKPDVGEITLKLEAEDALKGKAEPGTELEFEAVPASFTKEPFMLTCEVDKDKLSGWPVQAAPAKKGAPAKKAAVAPKKKAE